VDQNYLTKTLPREADLSIGGVEMERQNGNSRLLRQEQYSWHHLVGVGVDTSSAGRNGTAGAFIKRIEFVEATVRDRRPAGVRDRWDKTPAQSVCRHELGDLGWPRSSARCGLTLSKIP
jgi:hypothetical protein